MRCSRRNCPEERGPESGVHSHLSASKLNRLDAEADLNWLQADGFRVLFPGLTPCAPSNYVTCPGSGRHSMTSTESPGKIAKCGWFSNSFAAAS